MKVKVVAAVCCMVVCMATICAEGVPIVQCSCVHRSPTTVNVTKLRSYTVQKAGPCGISAIRFETELDKAICSDPNSDWAKNAMIYLDDKAKPAKATTTPIPLTTPRKGGSSPTNPITKSPVQDRGRGVRLYLFLLAMSCFLIVVFVFPHNHFDFATST